MRFLRGFSFSLVPPPRLNRADALPPSQIYYKNQLAATGTAHPAHLPLPSVLAIVIDSFTSATERHIEVGDGLEIFVVLARGRSLQGLEGVKGMSELTTTDDGERVFVVRRELKKD